MRDQEILDIELDGERHEITVELLNKYNVPGPRYTSYPTAPEWSDDYRCADHVADLAAANARETGEAERPVSLYFHIPFCERLCLYCGCNVVINKNKEVAPPYIERLTRETRMVASQVSRNRPVVQLHWGGGTPTYLSPAQIEEVFGAISEQFTIAADAEVGVEIDPRVTTPEHVRALRKVGFNRVSMGVQDFDPTVQQTVRRIQPFEATRDLVALCRESGFQSVNVDLIYGLPYQTAGSFADTIAKVEAIAPDRIAMYSYAHVPWLKKQQKSFAAHLPQGMDKFRIFRAGVTGFSKAGYVYIGMDHFAKPSDELAVALRARTLHRNFQGYSTRAHADLLGMGVSAISGLRRSYAQNYRDLAAYYAAVDRDDLPVMRGFALDEDDILRREVITRILCHRLISKGEIGRAFGIDFDSHFAGELRRVEDLVADGLVTLDGDVMRATPVGCIFLRNIAMVFDRYLQKQRIESPVFSRTL
ncbi:MAG: oxygen-independent coproporphyrinogen III oxidase [Candidatus Schekmanbacteria bacterium]|nr:oxygen-independent coproporphyrinogen III oxidase [Candidatus Schekmanbacteria bacterium]